MHTRAAVSQTLHDHLLAYVKQHSQLARLVALTTAVGLLTLVDGCVTRHQSTSHPIQPQISRLSTEGTSLVNINTAPSQELENLPGIGKVIAERIVAHREKYGPFRRPEHLMMVRGISDRKFREIRSLITAE